MQSIPQNKLISFKKGILVFLPLLSSLHFLPHLNPALPTTFRLQEEATEESSGTSHRGSLPAKQGKRAWGTLGTERLSNASSPPSPQLSTRLQLVFYTTGHSDPKGAPFHRIPILRNHGQYLLDNKTKHKLT